MRDWNTESKRWDSIESQLTSTLPATLKDFQDERNKIIELVPQQVKKEVGGRLDRYFVNVSKQFDRMEGKIEGLREELASSRQQLTELNAATRSVDTKVDATHKAVLTEQTLRSDQHRKVTDIVALISDFDSNRVNCDKCKDRVKLKGHGREELLSFHSRLIKTLQELQGSGTPQ